MELSADAVDSRGIQAKEVEWRWDDRDLEATAGLPG